MYKKLNIFFDFTNGQFGVAMKSFLNIRHIYFITASFFMLYSAFPSINTMKFYFF